MANKINAIYIIDFIVFYVLARGAWPPLGEAWA